MVAVKVLVILSLLAVKVLAVVVLLQQTQQVVLQHQGKVTMAEQVQQPRLWLWAAVVVVPMLSVEMLMWL
jgi:hypothetical protein